VKLRLELRFGFSLMAIILIAIAVLMPWGNVTNSHLGLLMLALIVVAIMLGYPTAFTLMGMGMFFGWLAYRSVNPQLAVPQVLDLMVQRTYGVMANDVLIAIPLFLFMGYLVERARLIDRLFRSLHLASVRLPGSLAVATIVTCAVFATATGIIGATVALMGLLAFPAMLKAGYNVKVSAGAVTAGGCLGILLPPSVLLIVYAATAGVSVVQLYAGAVFPGLMLATLYLAYIIVLAKVRPELMPQLPESESRVPLPPFAQALSRRGSHALVGLWRALVGTGDTGVTRRTALAQLFVSLLPAIAIAAVLGLTYRAVTAPHAGEAAEVQLGGLAVSAAFAAEEAKRPTELQNPPTKEPVAAEKEPSSPAAATTAERQPPPIWFGFMLAVGAAAIALISWLWNWERLEVFKLLLSSFFPLALLILAVLGSIVFGLATPAEAAGVGAFGALVLSAAYRFIGNWRAAPPEERSTRRVGVRTLGEFASIIKESSFLTARTSAMVCWLFVGSAIFSAAFALLGGQDLVERWVLSLDLTPLQFMIVAQLIIFILGWPLEWTEIIIIFMPIFIPLLPHFNIDPLFFGLLVALNLQTANLSPPVAMAAFYLKGVAPPHISLNQIFAGMLPFMGLQLVALVILYVWPQLGLWLPGVLYGR
jgi:TRAP-type mannitol/chloroaromatic compound transport system permease large subunit